MFHDLRDKNILVVGCSKGIGRNLADAIQSFSANLSLISRNNPNIQPANSNKVNFFELDITKEENYALALENLEPLDGVCFVAGVLKLTPPHLMNKKIIAQSFDVNLKSPLSLLSFLLKKRLIKNNSSIVFTSSVGRHSQPECSVSYAAAKMGILGAVNALASDLSKKQIRVNSVSFDYVLTEMSENLDKEQFTDGIVDVSPVEFTAIPYLFLLSSMSRWITGQIIAADAGRMLSKTRYV
jgi:NAD(P)-dependent dehydrogenase (short-subunit alcohol dehydrogenase family)